MEDKDLNFLYNTPDFITKILQKIPDFITKIFQKTPGFVTFTLISGS